MFGFSVTTAYASPARESVTIVDGDSKYTYLTTSKSVGDVINQFGISLNSSDFVYPAIDKKINHNDTIVIQRIKKLNVNCDGAVVTYWTDAGTYGEFFKRNSQTLGNEDYYDADPSKELEPDGNYVTVTRVTHGEESVETDIPYVTETLKDDTLETGLTVVKTKGVPGKKKTTYNVVYHNGTEISRNPVSEEIISEPVNEVISEGSAPKKVQSTVPVYSGTNGNTIMVDGQAIQYKKAITCSATAYDLSYESTGKHPGTPGFGITASGTYAKRGTVAVDPGVIPMGTRMFIVSTDGSVVYGYGTAEDTGGAIKGNRVDLLYDTRDECMQFGRRNVIVYIL